ncbi:hypothetical protein [Caballeronia sp. LZ034LL]|uniref:hypothetical protein n=1 Tax=Caballeronia sp. LZ034LL TaxID=3038567 RepID=UPI002856D899|nr:hypothetical protein [Caballeronia sp. LZ034LL]MDR5834569.1 hypothetical protein [Caballeronia sp. LZ034LL]
MQININRVFIMAMTGAALAATASVVLNWPVPVVLICELLPLCLYFSVLYRFGKNGLSHTAIDSVYYFGFIITILSLAGSVMRVWMFGIEKDLSSLIAQFGVGLLATGLALVFRLVLTARVESLNAKDLSQTIDEYVQRIDGIAVKVEMSAASFEGLSQSLQDRTRTVVESVHEECKSSMRSAAASFSESIAGMSRQASESVKRFGAMVESVATAPHIKQFDATVRDLAIGLKACAADLSNHGRLASEEALRATRQVLDASSEWHAETLGKMSQASQQTIQTTLAALSSIDFTIDTTTVKSDLVLLSRTITTFTKRFSDLDDKLASAHARHSVETLQPVIERFAEHLKQIGHDVQAQTAERFNYVSAKLASEAANGIAAMGEHVRAEHKQQVDALATHLDRLAMALEQADQRSAIESLVQRIDTFAENIDRLVAALDHTARSSGLERIEQRIDALAEISAQTVSAFERLGQASNNERLIERFDAFAENNNRLMSILERVALRANELPADSSSRSAAPDIPSVPIPTSAADPTLAPHVIPS